MTRVTKTKGGQSNIVIPLMIFPLPLSAQLELSYLFKISLNLSEATELSKTVALLSFNLPSESGKPYFYEFLLYLVWSELLEVSEVGVPDLV